MAGAKHHATAGPCLVSSVTMQRNQGGTRYRNSPAGQNPRISKGAHPVKEIYRDQNNPERRRQDMLHKNAVSYS